jgi:hypothetical protein
MNPTTQTLPPIITPHYPYIPPTFTPAIDWTSPEQVQHFVQSLDAPMFAPCIAQMGDNWVVWFVGKGYEDPTSDEGEER